MTNSLPKDSDADLGQKIQTFFYLGLTVIGTTLLAITAAQTSGVVAAVGVCTIIFLTSAAVGAVLGFLFALPRILTRDASDDASTAERRKAEAVVDQPIGKRLLGTNTNLEKVSDWLTTIIIGVGLTQLSSINSLLYSFRVFISETAKVFPDGHKCSAACSAGILPSIAPMILIFGLILGFLFLYLYTRVIISVMLNKVETDLHQPLPKPAADAVKSLVNTLPGANENVTFAATTSGEVPSVYEGLELMGSLLYQPNRYQDVINLAGQLSNTAAKNRPEYWLCQAAAFGQKHHALKESASPQELQSARDNALDAARRAVSIDPSMRARLWFISDPEGDDDDLADFREDPEFLKITGRWRKSGR